MSEENSLKRLPVNLGELSYALQQSDQTGMAHYLDLETGEIVMLTEDMRQVAEEVDAAIEENTENEDAAFEDALVHSDQPDWVVDSIRLVRAVEAGYGTRYVVVPSADSHEAYEDMADFIATITNRPIQEQLAEAITGRHPFRRFKDALLNFPQEREHWFAFSDERQRERAVDWLESIGVQLFEENR